MYVRFGLKYSRKREKGRILTIIEGGVIWRLYVFFFLLLYTVQSSRRTLRHLWWEMPWKMMLRPWSLPDSLFLIPRCHDMTMLPLPHAPHMMYYATTGPKWPGQAATDWNLWDPKSNGINWPWIETLETMSQNEPFLNPLSWLSQELVIGTKS